MGGKGRKPGSGGGGNRRQGIGETKKGRNGEVKKRDGKGWGWRGRRKKKGGRRVEEREMRLETKNWKNCCHTFFCFVPGYHFLFSPQVFPAMCPASTDRVVQMVGPIEYVLQCLQKLTEMLETAPPKGPRNNYDARNYDEYSATEYGGFHSNRTDGGLGKLGVLFCLCPFVFSNIAASYRARDRCGTDWPQHGDWRARHRRIQCHGATQPWRIRWGQHARVSVQLLAFMTL